MAFLYPKDGDIVSGTTEVVVGESSVGWSGGLINIDGMSLIAHTTSTTASGIGEYDLYYYEWDTSRAFNGLNQLLAVAHNIPAGSNGEARLTVRVEGGVPPPSLSAGQITWDDATNLMFQCQVKSIFEARTDAGNTDTLKLLHDRC